MDGTLGFTLQGVNQQPERVQPEGHVREQINLQPDPNTGLTSRPPTLLQHVYSTIPADASINTVLLEGELYLVVTYDNAGTGVVRVFGYDGTEYSVTLGTGAANYIRGDVVAYATEGAVYLVNRDMVVQSVVPAFDGYYRFGYYYALGGEFSRTYSVTIRYSDGATATGSYTTPDGTNPGDAALASANNIAQQILVGLNATKKASTVLSRFEEVVDIQDNSFTFTVTASDGAGNTVLRGGYNQANTFADVPRYAKHGSVIRITGETGDNADDTWLRFFANGISVVGAGFGVQGQWKETVDPNNQLAFNVATMPYVLTLNVGAGTATLNQGAWEPRRCGDNDSNPAPSFVGKTISDIGEFQRRLWLIAGGSFITSRTNVPTDFWRETTADTLPTDPVDIQTAGEEESELLYAVQYDTNLIVFSKAGQFLIDGSASLVSSTANIIRTTKFEMSTRARPVVAGDTVMFPYKFRVFAGVNEMQPASEITSNTVDSLNKTTQKYIRGEIIGLSSAGNSKILLVRTDDDFKRLYVYNFLWNGTQKVQSAWHKWEFSEDVVHTYVAEGVVYIWFRTAEGTKLCVLQPDKPLDFGLPYSLCMDMVEEVTGPVVDFDRNDYTFISVDDLNEDYAPGRKVTPESVVPIIGGFRYTFGDYAPTDMVAGVVFETALFPNAPQAKNWQGNARPQDTVVVREYLVDYVDSGEVEAYMINVYRSLDEIFLVSNARFPTADSPLDGFGTTITSGTFKVPFGDDQFTSSLVLRTKTAQPVTYIEIRWKGQVYRD